MLAKEHRVVLVDRTPLYTFAPSYTWVMMGKRDARRITRDLRSLMKRGIEFVMGEVERIDLATKGVVVAGRTLAYDYLIVALGAQYSSDEIEGLGQSWTFYHLDGAEGLRERLDTFRTGRIALVVSALPYRCPTALYEGAFLLDDHFRRLKARDDVDIHVYTPELTPLAAAGTRVGERITEMLADRGIGFTPGANLAEVDHRSRQLRFDGNTAAAFDLLIATPIHQCPAVVRDCGLTGQSGWIEVDRDTLSTAFENVHAIGDVTVIPLGEGKELPKTGVFAHGQAEVVARNIAAEIAGQEPIWAFGGQGGYPLSTSQEKAAFITGNFFADSGPNVRLRGPNRRWHWAKAGYERLWLWRWF
jgi:sulfide:quinone oxidoreductase